MKKLLSVILTLTLCFALASCGGSEDTDVPETQVFTTTDGLLTIETSEDWYEAEEYEAGWTILEIIDGNGIGLDLSTDVKSDYNMDLKAYNQYSIDMWEYDELVLSEQVQAGDRNAFKNILKYTVDDKNSIVCFYVIEMDNYYVVMDVYSLASDEEQVISYADEYAPKIEFSEEEAE